MTMVMKRVEDSKRRQMMSSGKHDKKNKKNGSGMDYDVSKLKFDIRVTYDCDEGEGCDQSLENGTYDQAVALFSGLESRTWIDCYYHYMSVDELSIHDENGEKLDLNEILDGDYAWLEDFSTSSKTEASEIPADCLKFLEDLKGGSGGKKAREIKELEKRIAELEKDLASSKAALAKLKA